MPSKPTPSRTESPTAERATATGSRYWLPRWFIVYGLLAVLNVINLFLISEGWLTGVPAALERVALGVARPVVLLQQALPLAVGDMLLAVGLVSLAEAALVMLLWWALAKARGQNPNPPA